MVSPCDLFAVATLSSSIQLFQLQCTLEQIGKVENGIYAPELFGGEPCGKACSTTDMETLGTGQVSPGNVLYSPESATRTMDALVAYRHCRCRVKASVFNLACDCSLWEAIRDHRSSGRAPQTTSFVQFQATLQEAEKASVGVMAHVAAIKELALHELKTLCPGGPSEPTVCSFRGPLASGSGKSYKLK